MRKIPGQWSLGFSRTCFLLLGKDLLSLKSHSSHTHRSQNSSTYSRMNPSQSVSLHDQFTHSAFFFFQCPNAYSHSGFSTLCNSVELEICKCPPFGFLFLFDHLLTLGSDLSFCLQFCNSFDPSSVPHRCPQSGISTLMYAERLTVAFLLQIWRVVERVRSSLIWVAKDLSEALNI